MSVFTPSPQTESISGELCHALGSLEVLHALLEAHGESVAAAVGLKKHAMTDAVAAVIATVQTAKVIADGESEEAFHG